MNRLVIGLALPLVATFTAVPAGGQQAPAPAMELAVGAPAPDFALPGATRFGVLKNPIRLSDFRGKTVVLAFFYKARTKG